MLQLDAEVFWKARGIRLNYQDVMSRIQETDNEIIGYDFTIGDADKLTEAILHFNNGEIITMEGNSFIKLMKTNPPLNYEGFRQAWMIEEL